MKKCFFYIRMYTARKKLYNINIYKGENRMERKMNLKKSLKNDYGLVLAFLAPIVSIAILCYFIFFAKIIDVNIISELPFLVLIRTSDFIIFFIFFVILVVGLVFFIKRIAYIKSFENENKKIDGKVVDIHYVKDRCGVDVEFDLYGTKCKKHFALMNNAQTKYIHMDSDVVLVMKDENPKKVLIEELYFN